MTAETSAGAILFDADQLTEIRDDYFEVEFWARSMRVERAQGGRGSVHFVGQDGSWALRHYQRGGLVARIVKDRYLYVGADLSRSFAEWRLLAKLHQLGLPVPAPVAARYVRRGAFYQADLITSRLAETITFSDALLADSDDLEQTAFDVGCTVRRFHNEGVDHADLNAHNVMLQRDKVFLLDFDKGRVRHAPGRWRDRNLSRLRRSVEKIAGPTFKQDRLSQIWHAVAAGYDN